MADNGPSLREAALRAAATADIFDQHKLEQIAEQVWLSVPVTARPTFTAERWMAAINEKCLPVLRRAEMKLEENGNDSALLQTKLRYMRSSLQQQVIRAMQTVGQRYRSGAATSPSKASKRR